MEGSEPKNNPAETLLDCIGMADQNLKIALLNVPDVVSFFDRLDKHLFAMCQLLSKIKFDGDDPTYIILNLLALAQRQMRNGFVSFLRRQGYDGQLVFRLGIEATIFAYRIYERPELGLVWVKRDEDPGAYKREFWRAEIPEKMPFEKNFDGYLDYLNDYRSHPSIFNFAGTLKREDGRLGLNYADGDETWYPTLFAFVSMCVKITSVFRTMIGSTAKVFLTSTEEEFEKIQEDLRRLRVRYRSKLPEPEQLFANG